MRAIAITLLTMAVQSISAQNIGGFLDFRRYFFAFDRGTITELEPLAPRAFASGGNYMAYAASNGDLKVYRDGKVTMLDQNIATLPSFTDYYIGYVTAGILKIYNGDTLLTLCRSTGASVVEDSIVGFYDDRQRTISIHYGSRTEQVEDALLDNPLNGWRSGDNILAWMSDMTKELKVYYHGEITVLASMVSDMRFNAGIDMVAYQDPMSKGLKVFYKGEVMDVDAFMPPKVEMGRGLFAYTDFSGAVKVFQNGKLHTAADYAPEEYYVMDSLVIMKDHGQMRVHREGSTDFVLPYWPTIWTVRWGTLAWVDNVGAVHIWQNGVENTVMQNDVVKMVTMDRGLLVISRTNNKVKIWWQGQLYEF